MLSHVKRTRKRKQIGRNHETSFYFLGDMETGEWDLINTESCKVAKQYENNVYMPTLDGTYNITLIKKPLYHTYMKKLKIVITGTQIALQSRSRLQEWEGLYKSLVEIK